MSKWKRMKVSRWEGEQVSERGKVRKSEDEQKDTVSLGFRGLSAVS